MNPAPCVASPWGLALPASVSGTVPFLTRNPAPAMFTVGPPVLPLQPQVCCVLPVPGTPSFHFALWIFQMARLALSLVF